MSNPNLTLSPEASQFLAGVAERKPAISRQMDEQIRAYVRDTGKGHDE